MHITYSMPTSIKQVIKTGKFGKLLLRSMPPFAEDVVCLFKSTKKVLKINQNNCFQKLQLQLYTAKSQY